MPHLFYLARPAYLRNSYIASAIHVPKLTSCTTTREAANANDATGTQDQPLVYVPLTAVHTCFSTVRRCAWASMPACVRKLLRLDLDLGVTCECMYDKNEAAPTMKYDVSYHTRSELRGRRLIGKVRYFRPRKRLFVFEYPL